MMWFFALLIVLLIGAVVVASTGAGEAMSEEYDDRPDVRVPADGPLGPDDLRRVRFTTAFRGYRASEVDALLDRLVRDLDGNPIRPSGLDVPLSPVADLPVVHAVRQSAPALGP